jgi:DMSO/TMAO reductase YedYZ molybdopterin-dependent catalytic subunit
MSPTSEGFTSPHLGSDPNLPPGQYTTGDFPIMSAGATPVISQREWELAVTTEAGGHHQFSFDSLLALGPEDIEVDLHCVTGWSKMGTQWRGVAVEKTLDAVGGTTAEHVLAHCYGGYTTNVPLEDLLDGQGWLAFEYEGEPLDPEHGGPVRLLVPHLYLWKSAKWLRRLELTEQSTPGFWETLGYHTYGDPWQQQRYWND